MIKSLQNIIILAIMLSQLCKGFAGASGKMLRPFRQLSHATYRHSEAIKVSVAGSINHTAAPELLVLPFFGPISSSMDRDCILEPGLKDIVSALLRENNFDGDRNVKRVIKLFDNKFKYIALVGLGPIPKSGCNDEWSRSLGEMAASVANDLKLNSVAVSATSIETERIDTEKLLLGIYDECYNDNRFKKVPENGHRICKLKSVTILNSSNDGAVLKRNAHTSECVSSGVHFAKDLVGEMLLNLLHSSKAIS